ncbi:MAG: glycosyl transferase family 2, partial [Nanoarchaeota archaeon]
FEDYHLWFNLLSRGATIKTIPEVLFLYRIKENSMYKEAFKYEKELLNQIKKDFPKVFDIGN